MNRLLIMLLTLVLTACGTTEPMIKVETRDVKTIVVQPYPPVAELPHPVLEITKLKNDDAPGVVVQAYQLTIEQLLLHIQQLDTQIKGINNARSANTSTP